MQKSLKAMSPFDIYEATPRPRSVLTPQQLLEVTKGFLYCMLWSTPNLDSNGDEMDIDLQDYWVDENAVAEALSLCREFLETLPCLPEIVTNYRAACQPYERNLSGLGHDFWLVKQRFGASFSDRNHLPKTLAYILEHHTSRWSDGTYVELGDDNIVHVHNMAAKNRFFKPNKFDLFG